MRNGSTTFITTTATGDVRATVVHFYGEDRRAAAAHAGQPLRRQAIYQGRVDPSRLYNARKLSDIHYVGSPGQEQKDVQLDYDADGQIAESIVFYYEGDLRASVAPSGAAVRRTVAYAGHPESVRAAPVS